MNNMDSFFYMRFEKDILLILIEAGDNGLSVNKISRHVFNTHNSFFLPLDYEKVHNEVLQCLQKMSRRSEPMIGKVKKGVYYINPANQQVKQLKLKFIDEEEENPIIEQPKDQSLSLFD